MSFVNPTPDSELDGEPRLPLTRGSQGFPLSNFNKLRIPKSYRTRRHFNHLRVVNDKDIVVAEPPSGIFTQMKNGNWENNARMFAAAPDALRELRSLIEPCEAAGINMRRARELLQRLADEQKPEVEEFRANSVEDLESPPSLSPGL